MGQRRRYAVETLVEDLLRLREAADELRPERAQELAAVEEHLRAFADSTVRGAVAARVLGVSHTAIAQRLREGELLHGRRQSDVDLDDLIDVAARLRRPGKSVRLAHVLRDRVSQRDRQAAAEVGVEPARLSRWLRTGVVVTSAESELDEAERRWLAQNGSLVREIDEVTRSDESIDTVVLFGSRARGDQRLESDVDLIVDGKIADDSRALAVLRGELLERLGRDVEIATLAEARAAPVVLLEAVHEGRALKDTAGRWRATVGESQAIAQQAAAERATYARRERVALSALGIGE